MNRSITRLAVVHETRPATILSEYASCRVVPNGVKEIRPQATAAPADGAAKTAEAARMHEATRTSRTADLYRAVRLVHWPGHEACPLRAEPDRLAAHRERAERRREPAARRLDAAPDRRPRPRAEYPRGRGRAPARPRVAGGRMGGRAGAAERAGGALSRGGGTAGRRSLRRDHARARGRHRALPPRERRRRR